MADAPKGRAKAALFILADAALPVIVLVASTAWAGIYPFGDRAFLTDDLMYQYIDFYAWFWSVLHGEESLLYSTAQALGNNTWPLYSYYLGSPLNLLLGLFDRDALVDFVYLATALKLAGMQLAASFFLCRRFQLQRFWCTLLALGFTWSSWTASQLCNLQWLDMLILLPLAAWGVHELVRRDRWKMLVFSVALAVVCCWYTAYMLVFFLCLYFLLELWLRQKSVDLGCDDAPSGSASTAAGEGRLPSRSAVRVVARFMAALAAALLLAAFTFVPTVMMMLQGASPLLEVGEPSKSAMDKILGMMAAHPAIAVGAVGCAAALVVAVVGIARSKKLKGEHRLRLSMAITVFVTVFALAVVQVLDLAGCTLLELLVGFTIQGPSVSDAPQLYEGVIIFVLCVLFFCSRKVPTGAKAACLLLFAFLVLSVFARPLYAAWCGFRTPSGFYCRIAPFVLFVMLWMAACLLFCERARFASLAPSLKAVLCALLAIVVVADVLVVVQRTWEHRYLHYPQSYHQAYEDESRQLAEELHQRDGGTYRIGKDYARAGMSALNEGMAIGYDELSSYSSTQNADVVAFLSDLGYCRIGEMSTRYAYPIMTSDALLGVKYAYSLLQGEGMVRISDEVNSMVASLYENPYALSLGYLVSEDARAIDFRGTEDPFQRQNRLMDGLTGESLDPYVPCETTMTQATDSEVRYEVHVPAGCLGYAYVLGGAWDGAPVYVQAEGRSRFKENFRFQDSICGIAGQSDDAQTVEVVLSASEGEVLEEDVRCVFYALDLSRFAEAIGLLSPGQATFQQFGGAGISCTVDAVPSEGGLLMMSVPNDPGWDVRVNGERVDAVDIAGGALMGIPVGAGENQVEMRYLPPGLLLGCAITLIMVVAIGVFSWTRRSSLVETRERK